MVTTRRVVQWSTGGVGAIALRAIARRPDLELAGFWVHEPGKAGRDAGELAGIDPVGVTATNDADALLALRPTASATRRAASRARPRPSPTSAACSRRASTS